VTAPENQVRQRTSIAYWTADNIAARRVAVRARRAATPHSWGVQSIRSRWPRCTPPWYALPD